MSTPVNISAAEHDPTSAHSEKSSTLAGISYNPEDNELTPISHQLCYPEGNNLSLNHGASKYLEASKFSVCAYSDYDWASGLDYKQSTSGSCIFFCPSLISWSSRKQSLVSCSNTKAEFRALAYTTLELLWL
ncbi:hypothetical protein KIW84_076334 [Lathyrus oleraceus]|uniref:Mitochondrial protein n=1 Tax=Pisum sativum TaxID=3888 RepID=A0A9D5A3A6_PEA|nr:hypothetical protein KIW84_076334 [Pisum sativum]